MTPLGATPTRHARTTGQKQRRSRALKMLRPHESAHPSSTPALPPLSASWLVQGPAAPTLQLRSCCFFLLLLFFLIFFEKPCQRLSLPRASSSTSTPSPPLPRPPFLPRPAWGSPQASDILLIHRMATWHNEQLLHLPVFEPSHSWNVLLILHSISWSRANLS